MRDAYICISHFLYMPTPLLSLTDVAVFQKEQLILNNVTFDINEGEFVYLIGKTGSGKSSLLKTIYGDLWLEMGEARFLDFELHALKSKQKPFLRRNMGIVFQDFQLLPDRDVQNNLRFFLKAMDWKDMANIDERIEEVLAEVGLNEIQSKMPHQLSGGEQQRLGIARALLNHPRIIIADEPTGNLDPAMSIDILKLFLKINEKHGTAILMATHDLELIERFPKRTMFCENSSVQDLSQNL